MRWSVLVSVAMAAMVIGTGGVGASLRTTLVGNGYDDVVVGISPLLEESKADEVIQAIKVAVSDASKALFRATGNKLFYKKVKILIPSTWTGVTVDQPATNEAFEDSHFRVDVRNPVYGDQVYTVQPGGCGDPGRYIHITPQYLTNAMAPSVWGPRGKVLAQAWARLRWGVFDEVGYPNDQRFPLFYRAWDDAQNLVVKPNHCTDKDIKGNYVDIHTGDSCNYVGDLPDDNCRFRPDEAQTATSSLMSFTDITNIEELCEDYKAGGHHDIYAPTRHNMMCNGRSVWEVMSTHKDFQNATKLPVDPEAPDVVVVQQSPASFALVLDKSGSMSGQYVENLANTAKRWLLHDVADGSFVTVIDFSSSASMKKTLTEVSNTTRQLLANAVTTNTYGSTCIGCGLNLAIQEMKNAKNKVILLITDGEENQSPYIDDVMDDVVESGARVVTISYGNKAEVTLEKLALNTGGKAYIVPGDDDGSFMDDAFQGSLTYQPGQTIINTDIKIYEWDDMVQGTGTINATFSVDATVGRNLEFRLDTETYISGDPYLTSPSGQTYTDSEFNSQVNLWIIKIDEAEVGTWTWSKPLSGGTTKLKVRVTAQARDAATLPIITESWMNTGADFVDASQQQVIVYARVSQGENPVVGAKVRAYVTTPDITAAAVELDLLDNGQNADVQAGDGIYSRYFTQFVSAGRYAVKAQVWDDGSSFINNGFITSRRTYLVDTPLGSSRFGFTDQLQNYEYCCGSVVPFNPDTAVPTGNFTRTAAAGSFNVVKMPVDGGDSFPPSQVRDLDIMVNDTATITLTWTAPGDDFDTGTVLGYEIWMSDNATDLNDDVSTNTSICILDLAHSTNTPEVLKEPGEKIVLPLKLDVALEPNMVYFVSLRAVDHDRNNGVMSRPVGFTDSFIQSGGVSVNGGVNPWTIALLILGCLKGLL